MNTTISIAGNLTDDVDLRFLPSGTPVAKLTIAVNRQVKDAKGEWKDAPSNFHDVKVWGPQAENVAETLRKGSEAVVIGQLETETWTNRDGENRSRQVIVVSQGYGAVGAGLRYATAQVTKTSRSSRTPANQPAEQPAQDNEPVSEPPF